MDGAGSDRSGGVAARQTPARRLGRRIPLVHDATGREVAILAWDAHYGWDAYGYLPPDGRDGGYLPGSWGLCDPCAPLRLRERAERACLQHAIKYWARLLGGHESGPS